MKQCRVFVAILGVLACVGVGRAAEDSAAAKMTRIGAVAWDQANLATLRSFGFSDVAEFLGAAGEEWQGENIATADCSRYCANFHMYEFTWAALTSNGRYHLLVVLQAFGVGGENRLLVYNQSPSGAITSQSIVGQDIHLEGTDYQMMPKVVQDLNGDGQDELIIPTSFFDSLRGTSPNAVWPKVYRLENGTYVDASREFPGFYDAQVLPKLNTAIEAVNERLGEAPLSSASSSAPSPESPVSSAAAEHVPCSMPVGAGIVCGGNRAIPNAPPPRPITLASAEQRPELIVGQMVLIMTRDKILRVLGRDPTAGLAQARAWLTGPKRYPRAAYTVIKDIGGHEDDLRTAQAEMPPFLRHVLDPNEPKAK